MLGHLGSVKESPQTGEGIKSWKEEKKMLYSLVFKLG